MRHGIRMALLCALAGVSSGCGIGAYAIAALAATGGGGGGGSDALPPTAPSSTAPVVQGVSPGVGPTSGGTVVTITGIRFASGATVEFGSLPASGVTFVSSFILTCTSPSYPLGPATVRVTNPDGKSGALANGFVFQGPAPTLASTSPTVGPMAGGTTITLTGTGFAPGATVTVGGTAASFVAVLSGTSCTAVTPPGTQGPATVTLTNLDQQAASLPGGHVYQGAAPTLTAVAPGTGPVAGGTLVTLTGTGFVAGASVTFGGTAAGGIAVVSPTTITCTTPTGVFTVSVVVTNIDLQGATLASGFTYTATAATVTSVAPASGPIAGGTLVTLTGSNFATGATVTFAGASATSVNVTSATSLTANTPAGSPGPANVVVTNPGASAGTLVGGYNYLGALPTVGSVTVSAGPMAGGTAVTVTGTNFYAGATITFGGTAAASVVFVNGTTLTCTTPAGAMGPATVVVTNVDGQAGTLPAGYIFQGAAPTLAGVSPAVGPTAGGTTVTVTGSNFATGVTVTFGGAAAGSVTLQSSSQLTCVTPAGAMGPTAVVVTNVDAQSATLPTGFTFQGPAPTLTSVLPGGGPMAGGTLVTLAGTNFATGATVTFGGTLATSVNVVTGIQITCNTPAGALGPATVVVTNVDFQGATLGNGFNFVGPSPTVTGVSPSTGGGGTFVTVTGTNFAGGATVLFGASLAGGVTVLSSTQITCATPSGTGSVSVTVTNIDGSGVTLGSAYTYSGTAATVTSVSPSSGTTAGGTAVTVTGAGFVSGATVTIGGLAASSPAFVSSTTITCTTPTGTAGPVNVDVTNPSSPAGTLVNGFTFLGPLPTLTGVAPGLGPMAGGTAVTLTGTNFVNGATVTVGGAAATSVVVVSGTSITCTTPAGAIGPQSVTITNIDTQSATLPAGFNFQGPVPTLVGVSPSAGPMAGGTVVTLTGTNFASGATVTFGGAAATGVALVSATQVTCTTPAGAIGPTTVVLTNIDGQAATLPAGFTFQGPVPTLGSVAPASGPVAGGTAVTLTGTNFAAGATVTFRGAAATSVVVVSGTSITCVTPAATLGPAPVTVTNVDAQSATLPGGFNFLGPLPTLTAVAPATGPLAGGTLVTCTGTNFATGATVTFGGAAASGVVVVSATSITCATPSGGGPVNVVVTNIDAQSATLTNGFTFVGTSPTVTGVTPGSGPAAGGTAVTLAGANFATGATVAIGGSAASSVVVVSGAQITCVTPAGTPGFANVTVTNPFASPGTLVGGYLFLGAAPTLTGVAPSSGPVAGGTAVTLTGTNFQSGATIDFGGAAATNVVFVSSVSLTATTPAHVLGVVTVTVTNPDTQTAPLGAGFTFLGPVPTLTGVSPAVCSTAGGTTITCTGTNFANGATVAVDGIAATGVVFISSSIVHAVTPAHATGFVGVTVTNPDAQVASRINAFEYRVPPSITTTLPASGSTNGGTRLVVYGSNFVAGATVSIRGVAATAIVVNPGGTQIRATTPAGTIGGAPVVVTNPDTLTATQAGGFTYATAGANPTVSVLDIEPGGGPPAGGTTVTIVGTNFQTLGTTGVWFGTGVATSVSVVNPTLLTAVTPAGANGTTVHVFVVNPNGLSATALNGFAYGTAFPVFGGCVSATAVSATAIELRWNPALDDVSPSRRIRYAVYLAATPGGQGFASPPDFLTDPGVLTFVVGGRAPSTTTYAVVRARDEANNQDANTVERSATTPAGPGGAKWTASGGLVTARSAHTATLLLDGRVLAAGGAGGGATAEVYDPLVATWTATASLGVSRTGHAAVLLPTGEVLVAGGSGLGMATSELWNPKTGTWTSTTGGLGTGRTAHTCTLLQGGKVLAVGGNNLGPQAGAELYDPGTGTWTTTGGLTTARYAHGAALLPNGKVVVAGGFDGTNPLGSAELYDPGTGTWTGAGTVPTARYNHTMTLVPDGRVIVAGGRVGIAATRNMDIYDPAKAQWTAGKPAASPRELHGATLLPGGSVLLAGGRNVGPVAVAELYDPVADAWALDASLNSAGYSGTLTLLPDGDALFGGGNSGLGNLATSEVHEASPAAGTWHAAAPYPGSPKSTPVVVPLPDGTVLLAAGRLGSGYDRTSQVYDRTTGTWTPTVSQLTTTRAYHAGTLLPNGEVLVSGGYNPSSLATAERYDPSTGTWSATGTMATVRYAHTSTLLRNGTVLVAGGAGPYTASVELYTPATGAWTTGTALPAVRGYHTATTLLDGRVLVAGGNTSGPIGSAVLYDPATGTWSATGSLITARASHTATILPTGKVLAVAGNGPSASILASAELYDPVTATWTAAGTLTTGRRYHAAQLLPDGSVVAIGGFGLAASLASVERYDPPQAAWAATGALANARFYHGTAGLADATVLVAAGALAGTTYTATCEILDTGAGAADVWRPRIDTVAGSTAQAVPLTFGASVAVTGARFRGVSEASAGHGQSSPGDVPIVTLVGPLGAHGGFMEDGVGATWPLPLTGSTTATTFTFTAPTQWSGGNPTGIGPGFYWLRVTVNGIPSEARIVKF